MEEIKTKSIDLASSRKLCLKHDVEYGQYPENQYEGGAIFEYVLEEIGDTRRAPSYEEWVDDLREMNEKMQERKEEK